MPVPSVITDLDPDPNDNFPVGSENVFPDLDNYLRAHAAFIRQNYDNKVDLADLADTTNPANGAALVGVKQSGTGAVARTARDKLLEFVSVKDFGAAADGTDDGPEFSLAAATSDEVHVFGGAYTLTTTPVLGGTLLEVHADATLLGAGASALGYTDNAKRQTIHSSADGSEFATRYIRRNANHVGGAVGFVSAGLRVDTYVGAGATNFEWAIVGVCDSSAAGGENVAVYGQGIKRGSGPVWGMVAEALDPTGAADPTAGLVGLEVDCRANGTDFNRNRVGIDVVVNRQLPAGAPPEVGFGVRVQNGGDAGAVVKTGFSLNCTAEVGFDASAATILQAAIKIGQGQEFALNASSTVSLRNDGAGVTIRSAGVDKVRLNYSGGIAINDLRTVITGTFSTGAQTPSLGANKPGGSGGAPGTWLSVTIDGTQYWCPLWSN